MKKNKIRFSSIVFAFFLGLFSIPVNDSLALNCPKVAGYTDRNCDGEFRIVFLGDSLVYGIGDSANKNKGGYVLRVANKLKAAKVHNFGVPGATSEQLLTILKAAFSENPTIRQKALADAVSSADIVVLDLGRNDYFLNERAQTPEQTLATLRAINTYIKKTLKDKDLVVPYLVQAVLMRPNRTDQGVFVKALDNLILKNNTPNFIADLRFDLVSKRLLARDQIHPTAKGYQALAVTFLSYLSKKIAPNL